jgi:hypothetical protein
MEMNSDSDEVLKLPQKESRAPRISHLVTFLTVREDVRAAIVAGYSVKDIWTSLRQADRIQCSYSRFLYHVNCMRGKGKQPLGWAGARIVALCAGIGKTPAQGSASTVAADRSQDDRRGANWGFIVKSVLEPKKLN